MSYVLVDTSDKLKGLIEIIDNQPSTLYCDIETTGLDWIKDKILLFQILMKGVVFLVDVRQLGYLALKELVSSIHKSGDVTVFHNAKFDLKFIAYKTGILLDNVYDTMIAEAVLSGGIGDKLYSLVKLVEKYTDYMMDKDTRKDFIDYPDDKPFTESMLNYSALDVIVLEPIHENQWKEVVKTQQDKIVKLENAVITVASKMEMDGIRLNKKEWLRVEKAAIERRDELNKQLVGMIVDFLMAMEVENGFELSQKASIPVKTKRLTKYLQEIVDISTLRGWLEENFNTKSSKQMLSVLNLMGVDVENTNEKTLTDFKEEHEIVKLLLDIREVNKQIDAYGSNVIELIHPDTGKIHTDYYTIGTATGRFSSRNPNMQQVPRSGGYRECFIPEEDYLFACVDYSQQEYRLAGWVSRDRRIIDAYKNGSDMHTATAQVVYKKDTVTKDERNLGKTLNFAILYGSTEWGLKHNLNISLDEAKRIIDDFWGGYPSLSKFMEVVGEKILQLGYSRTVLGRRRYNVEKPLYMNSKQLKKWQERVLREGRNHIIQGGGADILKLAMVEIYRRNPFGEKLKLCLQIHDELVTQVHNSVANEALKFIKDVMKEVEQQFLGEIPAEVEGDLKDKWSK